MARFLLTARAKYRILDGGARFHVISHLILETLNFGKPMLVSSILGREEPFEVSSNAMEAGTIFHLIQKDRVLAAVSLKPCQNSFTNPTADSLQGNSFPLVCKRVL